jgi:NADH-quinone oxidoreductase subunit K
MVFHLFIPLFLFLIGIFGILLSRKNVILILMSLELLLLSMNYYLIFFSTFLDDMMGQLFALFILSVAASESAIGLAIIISYYKNVYLKF